MQRIFSMEPVTDSPVIPDLVFEHMPNLLAGICRQIEHPRSRDLFLTASLPVLSAHMPSVRIRHAAGLFCPDLWCCLVDDGGEADRLVQLAGRFGEVLHRRLLSEDTGLFVDGTPVGASMSEVMSASANGALILSRDSASWFRNGTVNTEDQELRAIIRSGFYHDPITIRKGMGRSVIETPRFNMLFSAPSEGMRQNTREVWREMHAYFCFYLRGSTTIWQSARPGGNDEGLERELADASHRLDRLHQVLSSRAESVRVELSDMQWGMIDETFAEKMALLQEMDLSDALLVTNERMAIQAVRLACLFTVLSTWEHHPARLEGLKSLRPGHSDMVAALWLADTYIKHAIRLYESLPASGNTGRKGRRFEEFYHSLPPLFETSDALKLAHELQIPVRTAKRYLQQLARQRRIERIRHGTYRKQPQ